MPRPSLAPANLVRGALSLLLLAAPASAQVYYVDQGSPACSISGPGTELQPYCTISAALAAHSGPGITIYVKPGTYPEQVTVPASGAAGNPLVIQALGAGVAVDGADSFSSPAQWVLDSGAVYRAAAVIWSPVQVFMDGSRLAPSSLSPASMPSGSFTWVAGQGLYVNAGGSNPGAHVLLVGHRTYGFSVNAKSWVTIDGFDVSHAEDRGFNLGTGCTNLVISNNRVTFSNGYGIRCNGSTGILIENNRVSDSNFHGIGLLAASTACILRGNESFRNVDPAVSRANGIYVNASTNNTLARNRIHDNQDAGVFFTSGANDCISYNNVSWNNGDHGFDHLSATGTIHSNDVAFGNRNDGFSIEGNASGTQLHNSIAVDNGLTTGRYDLWVDGTSASGFVSDYNIFWNSTAQAPIRYIATNHTTLATYQSASLQDAHSLQANPNFVNAAGGDFSLLASSPAIDAADSGAPDWPSTDASGHARVDVPAVSNTGAGPVKYSDRGAMEFVADQTPVVTVPATATVAENGLLTVNVTAADPDGNAIASLTATGVPPGATFTPGPGNTSGTLSWTPGFTQAGSYSVTFTASNALSGSGTTAITVTNTDRAPVITAAATATVAETGLLTVNVTAADPDSDAITSLTATGVPAGATFTPGPGNTSGTLSWTPSFTQAGSYSVTFTARNALAGSSSTAITVTNVDRAPVVTAPATASVAEGHLLTLNFTVTDPDAEPITSLTATGVPPGATFTPGPGKTSGTLSWTPDFTQAGSYSVTFTAGNALSGSGTTAVTVTNADRGPVVTAPATASAAENGLLTVSVTAADPDGDAITSLTATGVPPGATFTPGSGNLSGALSWTPDFSQAGSYSVTFTASNALNGADTTAITVTNTDRPPVVTAPATASVAENGLLTVNVTVADPDGEPITSLTATGVPPGATFTPGPGNTTGTLSWTPDFTQAGSYSVSFAASNALNGSGTTAITVTNTDRAPVVNAPPSATVAEGQLLTVNFTVVDPDGDPITSLGAVAPPGSTFTPGPGNASGTLSWTPGFTQAGSYSVTFTASNALSGSNTTSIIVTNADRAPVITAPSTATVAENGLLTVNVTAADPDGDAITSLAATGVPAGATFTPGPGNTSGTLSWTPDFTQAGSYSVTFTAGNTLNGSGTTAVTVTNTDRAPVVTAPATASGAEGQLLTLNFTVADPDGDAITFLTAAGVPPGATLTPGPDNTSGTLTWRPDFTQAGSYNVTFTASNALSGSGTTAITVANTDRAPVVTGPGFATVAEGQPLTVNVTVADPDGEPITSLTATGVPSGATFTPGPGNTSGTLSWTPSFTRAGNYSVTLTARNALSGSQTTAITVTNVDRAPVVTAPATASVAENGLLTVNVTVADPDGSEITSLTATGLPAGATFTPAPGNTSGTLSWTPAFSQAGGYSVTFIASNALSGSGTTAITVTNVDRAPVVTAPATATVAENGLLTVNVTVADPDGDGIASLTATGVPAGATFTPGPGNTSGTLSWTPGFSQAGNYTATFTAGNVLNGSSTTAITVTNVDRAPVVTAPGTASVAENGLLTVNVTVADPDGEPITSLTASGVPAGATFTPGAGNTSGTLSWTPGFSQAGSYSVTFSAGNVLNGSSTTAITVTNTDRAPVVTTPPTATVAEGQLLTLNFTVADPDGDPITSLGAIGAPPGATLTPGPGNTSGTLSWTPGFTQAGGYSVTFTAGNALNGSGSTAVTVTNVDRAPVVTAPATATVAEGQLLTVNFTVADPDGEPINSLTATGVPPGATFTPGPGNTTGTLSWTPGFSQAGSYSVALTASNALSGSGTTAITVSNADRAPVITAPATATVAENGLLTVNVTATDPDGEPITSLTATGVPAGATLTSGPGNASGTLSWTPGFSQAGSYSVTFTASNALSGSSTTAITVTNTDRAPVVTVPATATVAENGLLTVNVTAADPDGNAITSLTATGLPAGATFTPAPGNTSGTLSWTPAFSQAGSYNVTFIASNALSGSGTTAITVTNTDRAPVVTAPGTASVAENGLLTVNVTVADPDGDGIASLTATGVPPGATFTPGPGNTSGTLSWTPGFTQAGSYSVTFTASNALSASSTTAITVTNTDRPPVVTAPATATVAENGVLTVNVTVADPDGDAITFLTASGAPAGATFTPGAGNASGTLSWTPGFTQAGSYSITFTASNALSASSTTAITVTNTDVAPVVTAPATVSVAENGVLTVNVTAADPDGNAITSLTATGVPAGATFTPGPGNTTGTLSWTPGFTQAGSYSVTFTAGNVLNGSSTTVVTVTNTDRPPVVTAPATATVAEGQLLTVNFTVTDPDGDHITSLSVTNAPSGAGMTSGPGSASGKLTWTPSFTQAGTYTVTFTARNALSGSSTTQITVTNTDRAPVVTAPATISVAAGDSIKVQITALDSDGDAIASLTATRVPADTLTATGLPSGAVFTPGPGNTSGALTWVPGASSVGTHVVIFTAHNSLAASDTTVITVTPGNTGVPGGVAERLTPRVVPNPMRDTGYLRFSLAREGAVRVDLFDLTGRLVGTPLNDAHAKAGVYDVPLGSASWNATQLPSGLYFYRIQGPDGTSRGRFMVRH